MHACYASKSKEINNLKKKTKKKKPARAERAEESETADIFSASRYVKRLPRSMCAEHRCRAECFPSLLLSGSTVKNSVATR